MLTYEHRTDDKDDHDQQFQRHTGMEFAASATEIYADDRDVDYSVRSPRPCPRHERVDVDTEECRCDWSWSDYFTRRRNLNAGQDHLSYVGDEDDWTPHEDGSIKVDRSAVARQRRAHVIAEKLPLGKALRRQVVDVIGEAENLLGFSKYHGGTIGAVLAESAYQFAAGDLERALDCRLVNSPQYQKLVEECGIDVADTLGYHFDTRDKGEFRAGEGRTDTRPPSCPEGNELDDPKAATTADRQSDAREAPASYKLYRDWLGENLTTS